MSAVAHVENEERKTLVRNLEELNVPCQLGLRVKTPHQEIAKELFADEGHVLLETVLHPL